MRPIAQRNANLASVIKAGVDAGTKSLRCAAPAIIQSFNPETQTVTAKIAIKEVIALQGTETETEIPLLVDVPIVVPRVGNYALVMTPQQGDECLIVFSDMCIDAWWQSGGIQSQAERRRHDLSDGFAILGCWSQPRRFENYPTEGMRLQSDKAAIIFDKNGCRFRNVDIDLMNVEINPLDMTVGVDVPEGETGAFVVNYQSEFNRLATFDSIRLKGARRWESLQSDVCTAVDDMPIEITELLGTVHMRGTVKLNDILGGQSRRVLFNVGEYAPVHRLRLNVPYRAGTTIISPEDRSQESTTVQLLIETSGDVVLSNNLMTYSADFGGGYMERRIAVNDEITLDCTWVI